MIIAVDERRLQFLCFSLNFNQLLYEQLYHIVLQVLLSAWAHNRRRLPRFRLATAHRAECALRRGRGERAGRAGGLFLWQWALV